LIELNQLTRRYGATLAVDNLTLELRPGEIFGFLGPNGAGKTTTFKMAVGLLRPDSGSVKICGFDIKQEERQAKACIGFVADDPFLYEKLNAEEFLELVCALWNVSRMDGEKRAERLLRLFDLYNVRADLIDTYSKGMKRKIALAAALIHDPKVLILDEPTDGLDPAAARMVRDLLRELADRGKTVFLSTHILEIAERFCDRVGIIDQGRLVAIGSVDELLVRRREESLEDLFLKLVGGDKQDEISAYLEKIGDKKTDTR
jgi:ABC-2 type transport system ATP-binding protein